jgi:hypothetical protein
MDRTLFEMGEIVNPFRNFVGCETERGTRRAEVAPATQAGQ